MPSAGYRENGVMAGDPISGIDIAGLYEAERIKRDYGAIISIADPDESTLGFRYEPYPEQLILRFADIDAPWPGFPLPTIDHAAEALAFARLNANEDLLVHCSAGVSRSPAVALGIIADRLGDGFEEAALAAVIAKRPEALPNMMVVHHMDEALARGGALVRALLAWQAGRLDLLLRRLQRAAGHLARALAEPR